MPRSNPTDVDLKFCETHVTMKLVLHDGTIKRLASARLFFIGEAGGQYEYKAHLMKDSEVKTSLTSLADQAQVGAQNVDRELGLTINDTAQTLTNAKVTFSKVFKQGGGTWDRKVLLEGVVSNAEIDENLAEIKIVSDVAPNVAFIGTRQVQEKCPLVFKGRACGYVGPLTTCNKVFDSADGCLGRNNQPRFGGVENSGELPAPILRGIDIPIGGGRIFHDGDGSLRFYPDPVDGRHRQIDLL